MTGKPVHKVCRLVWDYPVKGESTYGLQPVFVNLSEQQARQGYEVHVVAGKGPSQPSEEVVHGVNIHRVNVPFNLGAFREVERLTGNEGDWVVHTHSTCGFFLVGLRRMKRLRMVSQSHGASRSRHAPVRLKSGEIDLNYSQFRTIYNMIREKTLWSSADRVLTVSKSLLDDIVDSYNIDPRRGRVVYNGVDTDYFHPLGGTETPRPLEALAGKRIILYVGHFGLRKGVFYLIRAMSRVQSEVPDAHLVCVGGIPSWLGNRDYWSVLKHEIDSNGVSDRVTLLDKVKNRELLGYYNRAAVFALASYYESLSKVTMEAMACGLPVVATGSGGIPELVEQDVTGKLVPYGSEEALAQALITVLKDEGLARRMGSEGREKMVRSFTWRAVAERIRSVYDELT
jgi:glycosyltransferase involved in cell wall biosynthesis